VLCELLGPKSTLMSAERTVVVATHHLPKGIDCRELRVGQAQLA
jgi:ATP-binding cassette subfamily C protein CydC